MWSRGLRKLKQLLERQRGPRTPSALTSILWKRGSTLLIWLRGKSYEGGMSVCIPPGASQGSWLTTVSYTHLRAHETR
eukprot:12277406-Prorocentrum_lima.AAC.1